MTNANALTNAIMDYIAFKGGWELESEAMKQFNNPFGMGPRKNFKEVPFNKLTWYKSLEVAVLDFKKWIQEDKPKRYKAWTLYGNRKMYLGYYIHEDWIEFLKRRRYNTETPTYYDNLQVIYNQYKNIKSHE